MNLVNEVGVSHFRERWESALFFNEGGDPCYINSEATWISGTVACSVVKGTASKPKLEDANNPYECFKDLTMFKTPALGWRMAANGRYLVYLRRNNKAYRRGVSLTHVTGWLAPSTQLLVSTGDLSKDFYSRQSSRAMMIMKPEYMKLQQGLQAMRDGDVLSFAVSNNLAVIPDVDDKVSVYFNMSKVGTIGLDGSIVCNVPIIRSIIQEEMA